MQQPVARARQMALYRELLRITAKVAGCDVRLAMASLGFARAELQRTKFAEAENADDGLALKIIFDRRRRHVDALCTFKAKTHEGHRARALAVCIWDDGELARRALNNGSLEDRLFWAVLSDLAHRRHD